MLTQATKAIASKDCQANATLRTKDQKASKAQYEKARRRRRSAFKKSREWKTECGLQVLLVVQDDKTTRIYNSKPERQELSSLLRSWISSPSSPQATMDEGGIVQMWPHVVSGRIHTHIKQRSETSSSTRSQAQRRKLYRPGSRRTAFMRAKDWFRRLPSVAALVAGFD